MVMRSKRMAVLLWGKGSSGGGLLVRPKLTLWLPWQQVGLQVLNRKRPRHNSRSAGGVVVETEQEEVSSS